MFFASQNINNKNFLRYKNVKTCKKVTHSLAQMDKKNYLCSRKTGKSYTVSSFRILQGLTAAKVEGRSDAI